MRPVLTDSLLVEKITRDTDFIYLSYAVDENFVASELYRKYGTTKVTVQQLKSEVRIFQWHYFQYAVKLQEKYNLNHTLKYIHKALDVYRRRKRRNNGEALYNRDYVSACPNGLYFNDVTKTCDWPENVPNGSPYFIVDDETGILKSFPLPEVMITGDCYEFAMAPLSFFRDLNPCAYSDIFSNKNLSEAVDYMRNSPLNSDCHTNAEMYLHQVFMELDNNCSTDGNGSPIEITGDDGGSTGGGDENTGSSPHPSAEDLQSFIAYKPFALLPDSIPCAIVQEWETLAEYQPGSDIIDKLNQIVAAETAPSGVGGPGFTYEEVARVQQINSANSSVVNMDYFPVVIHEMPTVNGVQWTPEQLLSYIRKNDDTNLWNSNNPTGAVVAINMLGFDNGSVVTSYSSYNKWIFTTINEPWYGQHPVSGNREFGYSQNADGSYTFYTKGVDRLSNVFVSIAESSINLPFSIADGLWQSFQTSILTFVGAHSGSASLQEFKNIDQGGQTEITPYHYYRPDWEKVKKVLDGELPESSLRDGC